MKLSFFFIFVTHIKLSCFFFLKVPIESDKTLWNRQRRYFYLHFMNEEIVAQEGKNGLPKPYTQLSIFLPVEENLTWDSV